MPPRTSNKNTRSRRRRRSRFLRIVLAILVILLMTLVVVAAAGYRLTTQTPRWWASIDPQDAGVIDRAERVENALTSELSRADREGVSDDGHWQSEIWEIRLSAEEANAWLNARLPRWAENRLEDFQWPADVRSIQVAFEPGAVRLGASVVLDERERVLSAELMPRVADDGSVWLDVGWMYVGRLPVPAGLLLQTELFDLAPPSVADDPGLARLAEALAGKHAIVREPIIALGDGRRVRITSMELRDAELVLTCRTEHGDR